MGREYNLPWMLIAGRVGTRTPSQCMDKWYGGYGDRVMGVVYDDADDLALVNSIWEQDPELPMGVCHPSPVPCVRGLRGSACPARAALPAVAVCAFVMQCVWARIHPARVRMCTCGCVGAGRAGSGALRRQALQWRGE